MWTFGRHGSQIGNKFHYLSVTTSHPCRISTGESDVVGDKTIFPICIKSRGRVWIAVQLDKVQSAFPKNGRCWSVWLSSPLQPWAFSFISLTKTLFPRQLTTAINWLVAAVSDCVTLSSSSATGPLPPVISSGMVPEICSRLFASLSACKAQQAVVGMN